MTATTFIKSLNINFIKVKVKITNGEIKSYYILLVRTLMFATSEKWGICLENGLLRENKYLSNIIKTVLKYLSLLIIDRKTDLTDW